MIENYFCAEHVLSRLSQWPHGSVPAGPHPGPGRAALPMARYSPERPHGRRAGPMAQGTRRSPCGGEWSSRQGICNSTFPYSVWSPRSIWCASDCSGSARTGNPERAGGAHGSGSLAPALR
jgi:hypothetical protein